MLGTTQWHNCVLVSPRVMLLYLLQGNRGEARKTLARGYIHRPYRGFLQLFLATSKVDSRLANLLGAPLMGSVGHQVSLEKPFGVPSLSHSKPPSC